MPQSNAITTFHGTECGGHREILNKKRENRNALTGKIGGVDMNTNTNQDYPEPTRKSSVSVNPITHAPFGLVGAGRTEPQSARFKHENEVRTTLGDPRINAKNDVNNDMPPTPASMTGNGQSQDSSMFAMQTQAIGQKFVVNVNCKSDILDMVVNDKRRSIKWICEDKYGEPQTCSIEIPKTYDLSQLKITNQSADNCKVLIPAAESGVF